MWNVWKLKEESIQQFFNKEMKEKRKIWRLEFQWKQQGSKDSTHSEGRKLEENRVSRQIKRFTWRCKQQFSLERQYHSSQGTPIFLPGAWESETSVRRFRCMSANRHRFADTCLRTIWLRARKYHLLQSRQVVVFISSYFFMCCLQSFDDMRQD